MPIEHEAKVLDIDPVELERRILDKGGVKVAKRFMRRRVYDIVPGDWSKWIRLRDDGTEVTLCVKEHLHEGIDGTRETGVTVDDFDATNTLLNQLGYVSRNYQENMRASYLLDGAEVDIDHWPMIKPFLEIEAESESEVLRIADLLGFDESELKGNSFNVYGHYGIDLFAIESLRF